METLPLTEAKDRLSALVESVESTHETVTITRHGRPAAVLLAPDELHSLLETIEWLSREQTMANLAEAQAEIDADETLPFDQVREQLSAEAAPPDALPADDAVVRHVADQPLSTVEQAFSAQLSALRDDDLGALVETITGSQAGVRLVLDSLVRQGLIEPTGNERGLRVRGTVTTAGPSDAQQ